MDHDRILRRLLDLVYPQACRVCDQRVSQGPPLCAACRNRLPANERGCPLCAQPDTGSGPICGACQRHPPAFDGVYAPWHYTAPIDEWIRQFKYSDQISLARLLTDLTGADLAPKLGEWGTDALVPVPLHRQRLAQRGYNQAALLARPLARAHGLELLPQALQRTRATTPQATLPDGRRGSNVRGAFRAHPQTVAGRRVALVDDVVTSGATAEAAAQALLEAGAASVTVIAVARA